MTETTDPSCVCGEPAAPGTVHRTDGPCYVVVPSAPADRPALLREVANICDEAGAVYASNGRNDQAGAAYRLMERFLRKADEAEYVATPCSVGGCEPGGEPCTTHERLMAHAEGDHELCEPDCDPSRMADEAQQPETQAQPPLHRWYVETRDGVADQWAPGSRFTDRAEAAERYEHVTANWPTWKDGTPVERRLVQETTSYTVLATHGVPHVGGNAEDCPACKGTNPDYPFICPGPNPTP